MTPSPLAAIPQFSLARQTAALRPALRQAIERVLASGRFALGAETEALEQEAAAALGVPEAIACASGTDALHLALRAAGVGPGAAVLTTPFTFFATVEAILLTGAEVVFADISARGFGLDPAQVAAVVRRRKARRALAPLAAILPVHLYGGMADMAPLLAVAQAAGLPVIEDAAQAFGARSAVGAAGAVGLAGAFSFYPTKNLGALGEAGLVTTSDRRFAARVRALRTHGSPHRYRHERLGWNARMDELQAAILRVKLPQVAAWNRRRRQIAAHYEAALAPLAAGGKIALPERSEGHVFHQYTVRIPFLRDEVRAALQVQGIGTEVYYPIPAHRQPVMARHGAGRPGAAVAAPALPEAERAAAEVLSLPMFPELRDEEVACVAAALRSALEG
ncbi:MAG: DegT/DnrJ/EryC1/StrS family aminotransferase [Terriglobales bacterium]